MVSGRISKSCWSFGWVPRPHHAGESSASSICWCHLIHRYHFRLPFVIFSVNKEDRSLLVYQMHSFRGHM